MKTRADLTTFIGTLRESLPLLRERYQLESLGVFGSFVRSDQRAGSDLDLLVSFRKPPGLLQFIELENYLSDLLGIRVDLAMKDTLKRRIGKRILREVIALWQTNGRTLITSMTFWTLLRRSKSSHKECPTNSFAGIQKQPARSYTPSKSSERQPSDYLSTSL
jgi:predicted nucleotidyltransferase